MTPTQIAINTISTARPSFDATLQAYANAGFKQIEFNIPFIKEYLQTGKSVADVKALLSEYRLTSIGGFEAAAVVFGDEKARAENQQLLVGNANLLAELGGGVMVAGTDGPEKNSVAALEAIGARFRELVRDFPKSVSLAVEFNWSPIVKSVRSAQIVAQAANDPRVGILFDPAHYHCTSSKFEDLTPAVVKNIIHVHVNDMRDKPGEISNCNADRVLPGEGVLNLKALISRLEEHGYRGKFSIEMFNEDLWKLPVASAAQQCYRAMKSLCA
jgi:2-keto-myo-inositol isomerase